MPDRPDGARPPPFKLAHAATIRYGWPIRRIRWKKLIPPRWLRWVLIPTVPLCLLNLMVSVCGHSAVFPLSPFFLRAKASALVRYVGHIPRCLWTSHPPVVPPAVVAWAESHHRLPRGFLAAVLEVESNGRVHLISPAGAMGPGQLTPTTARALGVSDPFDPAENVDGAARYLAVQFAAFHDLRLAAAAYNAGPGSIVHGSIPHNGETEVYVARVMRAFAERRRAARHH